MRQIAFGTFDNFNMVVCRREGQYCRRHRAFHRNADDAVAGRGLDRIRTAGGSRQLSGRSFVGHLSSACKCTWHDGKPMTADDVLFSFDAFKKNSPFYGAYYRHVIKVEKTGEREIKFTFDGPGNRELPQIVGQLPVLPKHWWEGTDKSGRKRDITQTTLEPPLGSGPYRLKDSRPVAHWSTKRSTTIGARSSTSSSARAISRHSATSISATPPSHLRHSKAIKSTGASRTAPRTGQLHTISRPCGKSG